MVRTFLIDTDTAADDAVALIMALRAPEVRVAAITTVAGNVDLEQCTRNALYTVQLCGAHVPVYAGARKPLLRAHQDAKGFHGRDGLGDHEYPKPLRKAKPQHGVEAMVHAIKQNSGLVLVTLGPLTNVALAIVAYPEIAGNVSRCVVMGGAPCCEGNVTPAAEYNFWADPEAARIVLRSRLPVEMVGWQLCRGDAALNPKDIELVLALKTDRARFAIECNSRARKAHLQQTGEDVIPLADPIAMAIAIDPTIGNNWSEHYVDVENASDLTRGMTVVDRFNVAGSDNNRAVWAELLTGPRNAKVCWSLDTPRWKELLYFYLK